MTTGTESDATSPAKITYKPLTKEEERERHLWQVDVIVAQSEKNATLESENEKLTARIEELEADLHIMRQSDHGKLRTALWWIHRVGGEYGRHLGDECPQFKNYYYISDETNALLEAALKVTEPPKRGEE